MRGKSDRSSVLPKGSIMRAVAASIILASVVLSITFGPKPIAADSKSIMTVSLGLVIILVAL